MECPRSEETLTKGAPHAAGRELKLVRGGADNRVPAAGDDTSLRRALATDVDGSFERLVRVYQDRLYSFAHRLCGNPADAEEVAQDAFVRAYRALKSYAADKIEGLALRPWLYRIALNVARNRFRRKRHPTVPLGDRDGRLLHDPQDDPSARPDSRFEKAREREDLATLVAGLPDRYRSALILRYVEGLKLEEVAAILKQPLGTTKSHVHRAVNALRVAITQSRRRAEVRA
jgi:RNA polymerase sigma-70 factor (ECF subfamily)